MFGSFPAGGLDFLSDSLDYRRSGGFCLMTHSEIKISESTDICPKALIFCSKVRYNKGKYYHCGLAVFSPNYDYILTDYDLKVFAAVLPLFCQCFSVG